MARKREAEALRGRFQGCEEGIAFARALKDVAVRDQVIRSSADIPAELRKVLDGIEVGQLTPPESHQVRRRDVRDLRQEGIDGRQHAGQAPGPREPDGHSATSRRSKQYLQEIRRGAMLEYK